MSDVAGARTSRAGGSSVAGDAFLTRWTRDGVQRRWDLPDPTDPRAAPVTVGRAATAGVVVDDDPLVSRLHARLEPVGGQWTVVDDGLSRNGTFVNGRKITGRVRLRDRDTIRVGGTVLTLCAPASSGDGQTVAADDDLPAIRHLTAQQRLVLRALCRPYLTDHPYATPATNQQIADELFLSLDAVKTHLRVLYHKLGIDDLPQNLKRARLAELAWNLGLVADG